jgi:hypothetical protein
MYQNGEVMSFWKRQQTTLYIVNRGKYQNIMPIKQELSNPNDPK